jgi:hypothetical protein
VSISTSFCPHSGSLVGSTLGYQLLLRRNPLLYKLDTNLCQQSLIWRAPTNTPVPASLISFFSTTVPQPTSVQLVACKMENKMRCDHSHGCALTKMQTMFLRSKRLGPSENMPLVSNRPLFVLGFVFWVSHLEPPVNPGWDYALTVVDYGLNSHIMYIKILNMHIDINIHMYAHWFDSGYTSCASLHTLQYIPHGILSKTLRDIWDIL